MRSAKRILDLLVASALLVLTSPILLIIALLIKIGSEGPVLFMQNRIGKDGRIFRMCKFRTMVVNSQGVGTGLFSYSDDPRVTRVGRYLRSASLDELPQLFNVIAGTMSIVGPRPPVVHELDDYGLESKMKLRLTVRPGITGLAQVSGRNALEWPEKIALDNEYVDRFNRFGILEDIVVLLRTPSAIFSRRDVIEPRRGGGGLSI
jgi:lipopolysaccharide/colanic/teichoic acid biosynthesis glycosyltransferase